MNSNERIIELQTKLAAISVLANMIVSNNETTNQVIIRLETERNHFRNLLFQTQIHIEAYLGEYDPLSDRVVSIYDLLKEIKKALYGEGTHPRATASSNSD